MVYLVDDTAVARLCIESEALADIDTGRPGT